MPIHVWKGLPSLNSFLPSQDNGYLEGPFKEFGVWKYIYKALSLISSTIKTNQPIKQTKTLNEQQRYCQKTCLIN